MIIFSSWIDFMVLCINIVSFRMLFIAKRLLRPANGRQTRYTFEKVPCPSMDNVLNWRNRTLSPCVLR
jgi:hypothetical protein